MVFHEIRSACIASRSSGENFDRYFATVLVEYATGPWRVARVAVFRRHVFPLVDDHVVTGRDRQRVVLLVFQQRQFLVGGGRAEFRDTQIPLLAPCELDDRLVGDPVVVAGCLAFSDDEVLAFLPFDLYRVVGDDRGNDENVALTNQSVPFCCD